MRDDQETWRLSGIVAERVDTILSESFPTTSFEIAYDERVAEPRLEVRVSWVDGPRAIEVEVLTSHLREERAVTGIGEEVSSRAICALRRSASQETRLAVVAVALEADPSLDEALRRAVQGLGEAHRGLHQAASLATRMHHAEARLERALEELHAEAGRRVLGGVLDDVDLSLLPRSARGVAAIAVATHQRSDDLSAPGPQVSLRLRRETALVLTGIQRGRDCVVEASPAR